MCIGSLPVQRRRRSSLQKEASMTDSMRPPPPSALRTLSRALTIASGNEQMLRRRIARGSLVVDDQTQVTLDTIQQALAQAIEALHILEAR
jgi:hypothetical protein